MTATMDKAITESRPQNPLNNKLRLDAHSFVVDRDSYEPGCSTFTVMMSVP